MMTLWGLLISLSLVMPIAGAIASARLAHKGFAGYIVAILVGLMLGAACAWTLRKFGHFVVARQETRPVRAQELYLGTLYVAAVLWVLLALFAGSWTSSIILRLF
jgi:hypothetical protein